LKPYALFITVLNNTPSYFIIYKSLRALEMERKNNTLPSSKNGRVKCLWIKKNPYLCAVLLKAYKYEKREI